jgi:osmotically-inducible protein OsmY
MSDAEYLVEHIHQALADRVGELGVRATLTAGGVFLTGEVASPEQQQAVAGVVGALVPDRPVHNQTTVMDYPEPGGAERLV